MKKEKELKICWNCSSPFFYGHTHHTLKFKEIDTIYLCANCHYPNDFKNLEKLKTYEKMSGEVVFTNISLAEIEKYMVKENIIKKEPANG